MKDLSTVLYDIRELDDLGRKDTLVHSINSSIKIIVTFAYLIKILSMKNFNILNTGVILLYSMFIFIEGKIPVKAVVKKIIFVLPVVLGVSIVNLIINFSYGEIYFSVLLLFKCVMTLTVSLLLIATTGIDRLAIGLKNLKVPKILINQLLLLYRYIILLIEECYKIKYAYELRTSGEKSMTMKDFGSIMGHLLLRSIDRSEKIYYAMRLRGFDGNLYFSCTRKIKIFDICYLIANSLILIFI